MKSTIWVHSVCLIMSRTLHSCDKMQTFRFHLHWRSGTLSSLHLNLGGKVKNWEKDQGVKFLTLTNLMSESWKPGITTTIADISCHLSHLPLTTVNVVIIIQDNCSHHLSFSAVHQKLALFWEILSFFCPSGCRFTKMHQELQMEILCQKKRSQMETIWSDWWTLLMSWAPSHQQIPYQGHRQN